MRIRNLHWSSIVLLVLASALAHQSSLNSASAQGCIAIRPGVCQIDSGMGMLHSTNRLSSDWLVSVSYAFFESDRHFRGREEEKNRQRQGTEVINTVSTVTLGLSYSFNDRLSLNLTAPFMYAERSSLYEHDRVNRYTTRAAGIQDIRLTANYWLLNPSDYHDYNISLGLGVKAPTGDESADDTFYTDPDRDPTTPVVPVNRPVDQSIQPGDGGWGIPLELFAYWRFDDRWSAYASGSYLLNPRETNGTPTSRRRANEAIMSVADQYLGRVGLAFDVLPTNPMVTLTLGGRVEGIPVRDAIGGSKGFRRPGYTVSIEPGIVIGTPKYQFAAYAPVALLRNRQQSVTDIENSTPGNKVHGDAAFADWSIVASFALRF